jgi:hypothetical protein
VTLTPWAPVFTDRPIDEQPAAPAATNNGWGVYFFGFRERRRPGTRSPTVYPLRIGMTAVDGGFRQRFYDFLYGSGLQHKSFLAELEQQGLEVCYCYADVRAAVEVAAAAEPGKLPRTLVASIETSILGAFNFAANSSKNGGYRSLILPAEVRARLAEARRLEKTIPSQKALRTALMVE